jgi:hypothetical protein
MRTDRIFDIYLRMIVLLEIVVQLGVNEFHLYVFLLVAIFLTLVATGMNNRISQTMVNLGLIENKFLLDRVIFSIKNIRALKGSIMNYQSNTDPFDASIKPSISSQQAYVYYPLNT